MDIRYLQYIQYGIAHNSLVNGVSVTDDNAGALAVLVLGKRRNRYSIYQYGNVHGDAVGQTQ